MINIDAIIEEADWPKRTNDVSVFDEPKKSIAITPQLKSAVERLESIVEKFNPNHDHLGRFATGSGGGSGGEDSSIGVFKASEWLAKPVPQRRDDWAALPVARRDKLANAGKSVNNRQVELLKGFPKRPETDNLSNDIGVRATHFKNHIHPDAQARLTSMVNDYAKTLSDAKVPPDMQRKLAMEALDVVGAQHIEAMGRQLGDHGVNHIAGNIEIANGILQNMPGGVTPRDKAIAQTAMLFHDTGYLAPPSQHFMDEGHPRWSAEHYDTNLRDTVSKALGARAASEVGHIIRTHDSSDLDWKNDTVASACRMGDNLALFRKEKLPAVFRDIPDNLQVLKDLGAKKIDLKEAHTRMNDNIDKAAVPKQMADRYKTAVQEVSPITPKMTLGMLGGEITGVRWEKGHVQVKLKESPEVTELNKLGDFGQRQFGKFAESYGADPDQFKSSLSFIAKDKQGHTLMETLIEKTKRFLEMLMKSGWVDITT